MEETNIYRSLTGINNLKSEVSVKGFISTTCEDMMKYINAEGVSVYMFDREENILTSFVKLGEMSKYYDRCATIKYNKEDLEIINLRGIELNPLDKILNVRKSSGNKNFTYYNDDNFFEAYKLCVDDEFMGILNIMYKPENVRSKSQKDFIISMCKLISIIMRSWYLNKEILLESKRRAVIEKELDEYLDRSVDLVSIYNTKGELIKLSYSWTDILGWDKEDLLNRTIVDYIHLDDKNLFEDLIEFFLDGKDINNKSKEIRARYLCKDGSYKWINWHVQFSSNINNFICTGKDITIRMIEEERQRNLEEKIKLESMKSEFFTSMSHEFKTPLNIILGAMQVMDRYAQNDREIPTYDLKRYLKNIRQNSYRLLRLVNNLIDITKMDVGFYNVSLSENNIVNIIEDITLSVVEYAQNKNIEVIFDTDCEEVTMACDPDGIERVMLNLLSNAIKHMSKEKGQILVNVKNEEEFVFVSVKDNGLGIPEDKIDIIFDRFAQANADIKRKSEGSGIGLYIAQGIVRFHGGDIEVESKENEGSTFTFKLKKNLKINEVNNRFSVIEKHNFNVEKCKIEFSDIYS